jgi:hypothetical protein
MCAILLSAHVIVAILTVGPIAVAQSMFPSMTVKTPGSTAGV